MSRPHDSTPAATALPNDADEGPQITEIDCTQCGTRIAGMDGRYACPHCHWVNHWSEGHRALPTAEDDTDYPGRAGAGNTKARRSS